MTAASLHEVARFLSGCAPFDAMRADEVEALAASAQIEFARKGAEILGQGLPPQGSSFVVRSGAVELVDGDHVIDTLGPGEVFGHPSMMTGLPTGVAVRALQDTLLYRLAGDVVRPLLARPEGLRFVARTLLERSEAGRRGGPAVDLMLTPIGSLVRGPMLLCTPETTIRAAAEQMTAAGVSSVVVELDGGWGLLADSDLRAKVVAGPLSPDDPVSAAMTAPAYTVDAERSGTDVMLDMLDRRLRHVPVIGDDGRLVGVARAADLLAAQTRAPFLLREAIARAGSVPELATAAKGRRDSVVAMHQAALDAAHISAMLAVLDDAVMRRLVVLGHERLGPPPLPVGWLVFGSIARRESVLSSDVDCGMHWIDQGADGEHADAARAWAMRLARFVLDGLGTCGLKVDDHGVRADNPLVARPLSAWQQLIDKLAEDPWQTNAIALVLVLADGRAITGPPDTAGLIGFVHEAASRPQVMALLRRVAVQDPDKPGLRPGASLRHRLGGRASARMLDVKQQGLAPIVDIARWGGISAGVVANGTHQRLRGAGAAGVIEESDARSLIEAHVLLSELRLDHQVAQIGAGAEPDDEIDTADLDPLTRTYVRDAIREVAHVRRRIARAAHAS